MTGTLTTKATGSGGKKKKQSLAYDIELAHCKIIMLLTKCELEIKCYC